MSKENIDFKTFIELSNKLEIKMGTITSVEPMVKSDKMLKLEVSFGEEDNRTVMTNIGNRIEDINSLNMLQLPFITNLEPVKIMGILSEAMIMVGENDKGEVEVWKFTNGTKLM